jgi:putative ATPase
MKNLGYGAGYRYPHDEEDHFVAETYLPDALAGHTYYEPAAFGDEVEIAARLARWRERRGRSES